MNYIVLDMEWNQPGYADVTLCKNGVSMKNEIIQIGAVKLDQNKNKVSSFESIIKPVIFTTMNKTIKKLTGITDEMLDSGESFQDAIARFKAWCGEDYVILIWGYDDIRILKNNLAFHGMDDKWLPKNYNLQMIFCAQTGLEKRQYSLQFAVEHFGIELDERLHDALNDAEYTAMVCAKLDMENGIENLILSPASEKTDTGKSNVLIKRTFRHIRYRDDIWNNRFIVRPVCPCCGEKMKYDSPKRIGNWRINIEGHCETDGDFMIVLRLSETPEKTISVNQQIYMLDENTRLYFEAKHTKRHRKRPSGRGRANKESKTAETGETDE